MPSLTAAAPATPRRPPPPLRARRPHRPRRRVALRRARPRASASSARTASASRRCSRSWPDCSCPTPGSVRVDPPTATVGYLSQEHAPSRRRDRARRAAAPHRRGRRRGRRSPTAAAGLAGGGPGADDRYADRPRAATSRSRPATSRRASSRRLEQVGLPPDAADQPVDDALGRAGGARRAGRRPPGPLRHHPARRADQRPRLRRPRPASRTWWHGAPGGMVIVSHDRAFLDRTVTDVLELDEHSRTGRAYGGGWAGYQAERAADGRPRRRGLRRLRGPARRAAPSGPAGAPVGHHRRGPGEEAPARQRQGAAGLPHQPDRDGWPHGRGGPSVPSSRSRWSRSRGRAGTCASTSARRHGPATSSCAWRTP